MTREYAPTERRHPAAYRATKREAPSHTANLPAVPKKIVAPSKQTNLRYTENSQEKLSGSLVRSAVAPIRSHPNPAPKPVGFVLENCLHSAKLASKRKTAPPLFNCWFECVLLTPRTIPLGSKRNSAYGLTGIPSPIAAVSGHRRLFFASVSQIGYPKDRQSSFRRESPYPLANRCTRVHNSIDPSSNTYGHHHH